MAEVFLKPIRVEFRGRDADDHRLDLQALSVSLGGLSRLLRSASFVMTTGQMPPKKYKPTIQYFAMPPARGCYPLELIGKIDANMFQAMSEVFAAVGYEAMQRLVSSVFLLTGGRVSEVDAHIAKILELQAMMEVDRHEEQMAILGRWADSEKHVLDVIKTFAEYSQRNAQDVVQPVGTSSSEAQVGDVKAGGVVVDLPTAQVIRSKGKLSAGDMRTYKVLVDSITAHNRTVGLYLDIQPEILLRGDLVDPAAEEWPNIYQENVTKFLEITGKPVLKLDGEIQRLSVFDARAINEDAVSQELRDVARKISESRRSPQAG